MDREEKILGVRRNIFFLGLVSLFNDFSAEMVQAVMPVFITVVLGAPAEFLGFMEGLANALSSVLKFFSGWLSDRAERRKSWAASGYAIAVAARFLLAATSNFWQVFTLRMADRVGKGLRESPRDALIVESVEKNELAKSFNFHRMMDTTGATLGPLTAFAMLPLIAGNYRLFFLAAAMLGMFALLSFAFVHEGTTHQKMERPKMDLRLVRAHREFLLAMAGIFIFGLGALPIALVLLKGEDLGIGLAGVPLMYFLYGLAFVVTAVPLGKFADKIGTRTVIAFGFLLSAIAYGAFSHAAGAIAISSLFVLLGISSAATDGLERAFAAQLLKREVQATGQGFLQMTIGFSSLIAGVAGGWLWTAWGPPAALTYAAMLSTVGLLAFLGLTRYSIDNVQAQT